MNRRAPTREDVRKLDGAQEVCLIALACRELPNRALHCSLRRLADKLVKRENVEDVS